MDPNGGINPSNPRLDGVSPRPVPQRPIQSSAQDRQPAMDPASFSANQPTLDGMSPAPTLQGMAPPTLEDSVPSLGVPVPNHASNQTAQPAPLQDALLDTPVTKPKKGLMKKALLILGVLLVLAAIGGGAYYLGFTMGTSKGRQLADADYQRQLAEAQELAAEEEAQTTESTSAELDLKSLIEPKYVDETIDGEVGKQIQASDGFVIKINNIERNFKAADPNYKLDTSKELVKVNFLVGNIDKSKSKDISSFNFRLENSAGAQLTPENVANYDGKFDTVKLDPGGQAKGSIVYAINKDEKPLKFIREQRYRISGENREVTTRIVVVVAK